MACQHPHCSLPSNSICTNHCRWSLCSQHISEHRATLLSDFEQALHNLVEPTNKLFHSLTHAKENINDEQYKKLEQLHAAHQTQLRLLDEQLDGINQFQSQYNHIAEQIDKVKSNEYVLTQEDFRRLELLMQEIDRNKVVPVTSSPAHNRTRPSNAATLAPPATSVQQPEPIHCPLTSLNIYGLLPTHEVRLCKAQKPIRQLFEHLLHYHHLKNEYASQLVDAVLNDLDPTTTQVFPPDVIVNVNLDKRPCVFRDTPKEDGVHNTPCAFQVTDRYLPVHLRITHRLRAPQIDEILQKMNKQAE